MGKKELRVGFDLDGVIVDKPFFMPKPIIEWLYRAHNGNHKKYRYPKYKTEIWLRQFSHHWFFRKPLKNNLKEIKNFIKNKEATAFIVSSRYNFLKERTLAWFNYHELNGFFQSININFSNQQPHVSKEKTIRKLNLDYYFDDDRITIDYLKNKIPQTEFFLVKNNLKDLLKKIDTS
jgi:uncharacterized HAD superfamily protein